LGELFLLEISLLSQTPKKMPKITEKGTFL